MACGDGCLIDKDGKKPPDTELNCEDDCDEQNRYYTFAFLSEEQFAYIDECGTAENILIDIYDTKLQKYVTKGVSECVLSLSGFDVDNGVHIVFVHYAWNDIPKINVGLLFGHSTKVFVAIPYQILYGRDYAFIGQLFNPAIWIMCQPPSGIITGIDFHILLKSHIPPNHMRSCINDKEFEQVAFDKLTGFAVMKYLLRVAGD